MHTCAHASDLGWGRILPQGDEQSLARGEELIVHRKGLASAENLATCTV